MAYVFVLIYTFPYAYLFISLFPPSGFCFCSALPVCPLSFVAPTSSGPPYQLLSPTFSRVAACCAPGVVPPLFDASPLSIPEGVSLGSSGTDSAETGTRRPWATAGGQRFLFQGNPHLCPADQVGPTPTWGHPVGKPLSPNRGRLSPKQ